MSDGEIIIIKRGGDEEHEHHSSAWKVAHADFMTAMMAFFLIMWLISVTDDEVRKGISAYFNPIKLAEGHTDLKGLAKPSSAPPKDGGKRGHADEAPSEAFNPMKLSAGHSEAEGHDEEGDDAHADEAEGHPAEGLDEHDEGAGLDDQGETAADGYAGASPDPTDAEVHGKALSGGGNVDEEVEMAAFQDPYAVLAQLADEYATDTAASSDTIVGDPRKPGVAGGDIDRDPFDPVYWQLEPLPPARTSMPGEQGKSASLPLGERIDATAPLPSEQAGPIDIDGVNVDPGPEVEVSRSAAEIVAEIEGNAVAALQEKAPFVREVAIDPLPEQAVDDDVVRELESGEEATEGPPVQIVAAGLSDQALEAIENAEDDPQALSEAIEETLEQVVQETAAGAPTAALSVEATGEGVMIDLTDQLTFAMFEVGSAVPNGQVVVLMEQIAEVLAQTPGKIIIRGHTDARPFKSKTYDNWRLSSARAHMAYFMLRRGGLPEDRVIAIEGRADRDLLNPFSPLASENRRIEILLQVTP